MTNLHDIVLQITDKIVKNEIKVKTCDTVYETHIAKDMTNLHDIVLQITDKIVKNEIKVKTCDTVYETHIAKELNIYVHTVPRVVNKTADSLRINPLNELPQQMCWDKFISVASAEASMSFA